MTALTYLVCEACWGPCTSAVVLADTLLCCLETMHFALVLRVEHSNVPSITLAASCLQGQVFYHWVTDPGPEIKIGLKGMAFYMSLQKSRLYQKKKIMLKQKIKFGGWRDITKDKALDLLAVNFSLILSITWFHEDGSLWITSEHRAKNSPEYCGG